MPLKLGTAVVLALGALTMLTDRGACADTDIPALHVSADAGLLTVSIVAAPLSDVLREIADRTKVKIEMRGDLTTPVTAAFTDVPLDDGLKRLARGHSVCLFYAPGRQAEAPSLSEAWVIATPSRGAAAPGSDPGRRAAWLAQVQALTARGDETALQALARLLSRNDDPVVRAQAATALGGFPHGIGESELAAALGSDPDPRVRRMAARALGRLRTDESRRALDGASADADPAVRREASRALSRWSSPAP